METKFEEKYKRLYRSEDDRIVAGVCSGVGDYFNVDPVLVRVAWIISIFIWGGGIWIYLLAWLLIPRKPYDLN